jgi:hypothetical protein
VQGRVGVSVATEASQGAGVRVRNAGRVGRLGRAHPGHYRTSPRQFASEDLPDAAQCHRRPGGPRPAACREAGPCRTTCVRAPSPAARYRPRSREKAARQGESIISRLKAASASQTCLNGPTRSTVRTHDWVERARDVDDRVLGRHTRPGRRRCQSLLRSSWDGHGTLKVDFSRASRAHCAMCVPDVSVSLAMGSTGARFRVKGRATGKLDRRRPDKVARENAK